MTLQGTAAVRELKNNTKNRKIMQVEEQLYGIHIYIYIYVYIMYTPLWTNNAIPIHNHRWSRILI